MAFLLPLFFTSGIPALLYQVVWQRALFTIYGTNTESATAVVAAFLLGLGLGAHLGGTIATRWPKRLLLIYGGIELAIGAFGIGSLTIFDWVGVHFTTASMAQTGLVAFVLVVLPTVLMGATLPILAAYLIARRGHVGNGVGALYFVNTLGSAAACFLASLLLMDALGQHGTLAVAAALNLAVGVGSATLSRLPEVRSVPVLPEDFHRPRRLTALPLAPGWAAFLAGVTGYLSLSFEMLWFRAYGFVSGGSARDFAHLLGFFLAGIALGGLAGRPLSRWADRSALSGRMVPSALLVAAAAVALLCIPSMGLVPEGAPPELGLVVVMVVAGLWAALFPVIAHLSVVPDQRAGARIGALYLANVIGSVAGCLLTGFVLTDHLGTQTLSALLTMISAAVAIVMWLGARPAERWAPAGVLAVIAVGLGAAAQPLYADIYERLLYRRPAEGGMAFAHVIETKEGVIAVAKDGVIYGGGVYDGRMQIDFAHDENGIFRPFALSAFAAAPKRVLMIGLSGGAWGQVIAHHPEVESLTVVEISRGYLDLIGRYPLMQGLLTNPKVRIVIDDGRRWLRNHRGEGFDAIIMNTTFHWRSFASNILSAEFLELVKSRVKPGGVVMFNATGSSEVHRTAASVFPDALRFTNQMVAGTAPIVIDSARWERIMLSYAINGRKVVGDDEDSRKAMAQNHARLRTIDSSTAGEWDGMESRAHILTRTQGLRVITDDNMGLEWRSHAR